MRILLDTHALLWWLAGDTSLTLTARSAIAEAMVEKMAWVSNETAFDALPVLRVW